MQDAIDPEANCENSCVWLQVNIRSPLLYRLRHQITDQFDDRSLLRHLTQLLDIATFRSTSCDLSRQPIKHALLVLCTRQAPVHAPAWIGMAHTFSQGRKQRVSRSTKQIIAFGRPKQ